MLSILLGSWYSLNMVTYVSCFKCKNIDLERQIYAFYCLILICDDNMMMYYLLMFLLMTSTFYIILSFNFSTSMYLSTGADLEEMPGGSRFHTAHKASQKILEPPDCFWNPPSSHNLLSSWFKKCIKHK